jgi:hypothetical protein
MPASLPLPAIAFSAVGMQPPQSLELDYEGRLAALPEADFVIVTNSEEWSALDHVFLSHRSAREPDDTKWQRRWHAYARNAPQAQTEEDRFDIQWGFYAVARVPALDGKAYGVLLFKVDPFVSGALGAEGLARLYSQILGECQPSVMIAMCNAFSCRSGDVPGDVAITNMARSEEVRHDYTSTLQEPDPELMSAIAERLLLPFARICTDEDLEFALEELSHRSDVERGAEDLLAPYTSEEAQGGAVIHCRFGTPVMTLDDAGQLTELQESLDHAAADFDGVLLAEASDHAGTDFLLVRSIATPLPAEDTGEARMLASIVGETVAFHTSYNGALAAWGAIAGIRWWEPA